jgi:hypothetical protein
VLRTDLRPSTLILLGLALVLAVTQPVVIVAAVAVTAWMIATPAALVAALLVTAAWRVLHPTAVVR